MHPRLPALLRPLLRTLLLIAAVAVPAGLRAATPQKPNVLFIAIDDLRDWVGYFGRNPQAKTPNFDRLAKLATSFTRAYCASPVCNPSRAALMSGLRPSTSGVYENNVDFRPIIPREDKMLTTTRSARPATSSMRRRQNLPRVLPTATASGTTTSRKRRRWRLKPEKKSPAGQSDGVGGIKFAPLDCKPTKTCPTGKITDYGIAQLGKKARQALLPRRRPAQAAHAVECPAQVVRPVPARASDPSSRRTSPTTSPTCRPPASRMARPGGDHAADGEVRPLEGSRAGLPRHHRLLPT